MLKALRGLVALGILAWLGWRLAQDFEALRHLPLDPQPLDLAGATLAGLGALLLLALLFPALLTVTGHARPGHSAYYARIWLQSYFHRYVPGKIVLVVERVRMGDQVGLARSTSVLLLAWETVLLLVGACLAGALGLAAVGSEVAGGPALPGVVGVGALLMAGILVAPRALRWVLQRMPFLRSKAHHFTLEARPRDWAGLALGYGLVWGLLGLSFALSCRWFPAGAEAGVEEALWYVLAYVGGMVVGLTPAGLGVREGLLVAGLATRYDPAAALAFALASRLLLTAVELPLVGLATLIRRPRSSVE